MKTYGGFVATDPLASPTPAEHHRGTALSTGRACFSVVLGTVRPAHVHLPFFVCDALLQPLRAAAVRYSFYALDHQLRPLWRDASTPPDPDHLIVFINYFGVLGREASACAARLRQQVVIDNVHAFFHRSVPETWAFNSARKFFAVTDGAYLTGPEVSLGPLTPAVHDDAHLFGGAGSPDAAFAAYRRHEAALDDAVLGMSSTSAARLRSLDYDAIARRRQANYRRLHASLGAVNALALPLIGDDVPLAYPFLPPVDIREELVRLGVFVPAFWTEVVSRPARGFEWERHLGARLCPLPIDQRYDDRDMLDVVSRVLRALRS